MYPSNDKTFSRQKLNKIPTTISIYSNFLKFLSFIGIFPHKLIKITNNNNKNVIQHNLSCKVWLVLLFEIIHVGSIIHRLYCIGITDKSSIILLSVWVLRDIMCIIIVCTFLAKKEVFTDLLNNWNKIESEILEEYRSKSNNLVKQAIAYQRKWYRIMIALIVISLVAVETFIFLDHLAPHHQISTSLENNSNSNAGQSVFFSLIAQSFSLVINRIILAQFEMLLFAIASSIRYCIRIISPVGIKGLDEPEGQEQEHHAIGHIKKVRPMITTIGDQCINGTCTFNPFTLSWPNYHQLKTAADALKYYKKLNQLVIEFNNIFKWLLFTFKTSIVLHLCGVTYMSCRFIRMPLATSSSSSHSILNTTQNVFNEQQQQQIDDDGPNQLNCFLAIIIFLNAIEHLLKIHLILYPLGAVVTETKSFGYKWIQVLWNLQKQQQINQQQSSSSYKNIRDEINDACKIPIAFQVGCFYVIKPSTVLTFFSIVTTYLIVLLQI